MARRISNIRLFIVSVQSMAIGLRLTLKHFFVSIGVKRKPQVGVMDADYFTHKDGIVTNLYPHESIPVPDNGRYRLHNEVDDCIVCDLCAKVCPVNCIDIEPIKSPVEIGKTSDGSTKRIYAATFDIDMAKCCFCGLCTTVCPTECLTMTKTYDFSEYDVRNMVYHFAELSPAEGVLKKEEMEVLVAEEKAKKAAAAKPVPEAGEATTDTATAAPKPAFKPKVTIPAVKKPAVDAAAENTTPAKAEEASASSDTAAEKPAVPKPVFKPKVVIPAKKSITETSSEETSETKPADEPAASTEAGTPKPQVKPVMKPVIPKAPVAESEEQAVNPATDVPASEQTAAPAQHLQPAAKPKPIMKPVMKPVIPKEPAPESTQQTASPAMDLSASDQSDAPAEEAKPAARPKPIMKPVMKPIIPKKTEEGGETNA